MSHTKYWIGVDPGKTGGLAYIDNKGIAQTIPMPVAENELDLHSIVEWFKELSNGDVLVCIEKVGAMPGQGVVSMFTFGMGTGMLHGIIAAVGYKKIVVAPQTWKTKILRDTKKDKAAAINYCLSMYPGVDLKATPRCKKYHDGMADALCIATYAKLTYVDI
jgi:crossover junction endodeoxyribonuclease RuvC